MELKKHTSVSMKKYHFFAVVCVLSTIQGCLLGQKMDDRGEALGVSGRVGWKMEAPAGMIFIPGGSFKIGSVDQDAASCVNPPRQVAVSSFYADEHAVTNNQYRQFIETLLGEATSQQEQDIAEDQVGDPISDAIEDDVSMEKGADAGTISEEFIMQHLYPDMKRWKEDFSHQMSDPMMDEYYEHVAFDNFPVVGVTWEAARYFAAWRTRYLNEYREKKDLWPMPKFRLPTAAEWTYAARGGKEFSKYPWGNHVRDTEGNLLANFKSNRGNYRECKYDYTAPVDYFPCNSYGLHIGGNVSEWTIDAYNPAATVRMWDLNPVYYNEDQPIKVVKGGSWKDIARFVQTDAIDYEHKDRARSYIGFRCVMSHIGEEPN